MPTPLIRHPAIAFSSEYQAEVKEKTPHNSPMRDPYSKLMLKYLPSRKLYDFRKSYYDGMGVPHQWPFVIDADEFILNPKPYMDHFCELTGIDASQLQYEWQPLTATELATTVVGRNHYLSTLHGSGAVLREKSNLNVDIEAEVAELSADFGDEIGRKMRNWITSSMPDYEYLRARRWILTGCQMDPKVLEKRIYFVP